MRGWLAISGAGSGPASRPSWQRSLFAFVRLARPKFLLGGLAIYALGALAAFSTGVEPRPFELFTGLIAMVAIQLMTHYANDYYDYEADLANVTPTQWSGGSRVLTSGELPREAALWGALGTAALALVAMAALALGAARPAAGLLVLGLMLVLSWSYSSPPLCLHTRGLGEPTVALVVPVLTPLSAFALQTGQLGLLPVVLGTPLAMLQVAMLLTVELSDEQGDRAVGKRSWVVILGPRRAARLCQALIVCAFLASFWSLRFGVPGGVGVAWACLLPFGVFQLSRMLRGQWRRPACWNGLAFGAAALFFLSIVAGLVGLTTSAGFS